MKTARKSAQERTITRMVDLEEMLANQVADNTIHIKHLFAYIERLEARLSAIENKETPTDDR